MRLDPTKEAIRQREHDRNCESVEFAAFANGSSVLAWGRWVHLVQHDQ